MMGARRREVENTKVYEVPAGCPAPPHSYSHELYTSSSITLSANQNHQPNLLLKPDTPGELLWWDGGWALRTLPLMAPPPSPPPAAPLVLPHKLDLKHHAQFICIQLLKELDSLPVFQIQRLRPRGVR